MISKECRDTRREIDELDLNQRTTDRATAHLESCSACREFRAERTALREMIGSLEPVTAPADFDMRLRARIAAEKSSPRQPFFAQLFSTPALAAAALFVVVAGSVVWIAQRPSSVPVATSKTTVSTTPFKNNVDSTAPAPAKQNDSTVNDTNDDDRKLVASNGAGRRRVSRNSVRSHDYLVQENIPVKQTDSAAYVPTKRVEFALEDERGNTRKVSVPAVSFGAQSLVDNRTPIAYSANSRVW